MAVEERAASTGASWRRTQRVIRRDATGRLPAGTPSTRPQSRATRENILVFNAGLGSTSSPAPAGKAARGPRTAARFARAARRAPCRKDEMRPPSRTARDGVELPSLGTGQPPRAAGAAGPAATPRFPSPRVSGSRDGSQPPLYSTSELRSGPSRRRCPWPRARRRRPGPRASAARGRRRNGVGDAVRVGSTAFRSCALAREPLPPPRRPPRRLAPDATPSTRRSSRDCVRAMACEPPNTHTHKESKRDRH